MKTLLPLFLVSLAACMEGGSGASSGPVSLAYVASAANNHVQVLDLESGRTLRKIYAGPTPWRLVVSPGDRQLWVQHWYSATTAVVDLESHEIVRLLPFRGPGTFTAGGERFVTFDWPGSFLQVLDAASFERLEERPTDAPQIYDLAASGTGDELYMIQHDPMAQGPRSRYGYVLSYPLAAADPSHAVPRSLRTGRSPVEVRVLDDFILTADHETNGLSLINRLGEGRRVPTCPSPRRILLSPDETRLLVACWPGDGWPESHLVAYRADFTTRPWPTITQLEDRTFRGALVSGAFSPDGETVYLADRLGHRLLELDPESLEPRRELATGEMPVDVAVIALPSAVRDRLAAGKSKGRQIAEEALAALHRAGKPFRDLSWTETITWTGPEHEEGAGEEEDHGTAPDGRRLENVLSASGALRSESPEGGVRLAAGGHTLSLDGSGRFWVAPRQELVSILYALPNFSPDEALRQLAGDVPGSPWLRGGLAVDVAAEVEEGETRYYVVGAPRDGARTSQVWIDASTGRPTNLGEQFPVFGSRAHDGEAAGFGGIVETKFHHFADVGDGFVFPSELERVLGGAESQTVHLENVRRDTGVREELFALDRLGGVAPASAAPLAVPAAAPDDSGEPGRAVPILDDGYLSSHWQPHQPYNSVPPTSGPRLHGLADWGVHRLPVPPELQVHNLEHGGVALQYDCPGGCPDLADELARLSERWQRVIVAPYPGLPGRIALSAWGRLEILEDFDEERIARFVEAYVDQDHHRGSGTMEH